MAATKRGCQPAAWFSAAVTTGACAYLRCIALLVGVAVGGADKAHVLVAFVAVVQVLANGVVVAGEGERTRVLVPEPAARIAQASVRNELVRARGPAALDALHQLHQLDGVHLPRHFVAPRPDQRLHGRGVELPHHDHGVRWFHKPISAPPQRTCNSDRSKASLHRSPACTLALHPTPNSMLALAKSRHSNARSTAVWRCSPAGALRGTLRCHGVYSP